MLVVSTYLFKTSSFCGNVFLYISKILFFRLNYQTLCFVEERAVSAQLCSLIQKKFHSYILCRQVPHHELIPKLPPFPLALEIVLLQPLPKIHNYILG